MLYDGHLGAGITQNLPNRLILAHAREDLMMAVRDNQVSGF